MSEERKVKFAPMKLIRQASQYWAKLETLRELRGEHPIGTWRDMKTQLKQKYLLPSYYQRLLDKWNQFSQGSKSAKEYTAKFDEFPIRCSTLETETPMQVLSRFRAGLQEDLKSELFAGNADTLEKIYALVQDLDEIRSRKNQDCKASVPRPPSQSYQNRATSSSSQPQTDNKSKGIERSIPKSNP